MDTTSFSIIQTRHFYGPYPAECGLVDEHDQPAKFPSRAAAKAHIATLEQAGYIEAAGEYGRPSYRVVKSSSRAVARLSVNPYTR